jgi:hypothetical protein
MKKGKKGDYYKQKTEDLKKEDENFPDDELDQVRLTAINLDYFFLF